MEKQLKFQALRAEQAQGQDVFVFTSTSNDILRFAQIERVGRADDGSLKGFQRHQISSHIKEIRDYLSRDDALLPNALIVAFTSGVKVRRLAGSAIEITIDISQGPPGFVVDGQQRLTALSGLTKPNFEVFVSALICKDFDQLRQQFVLINNTRPLPKTLIYELLPTVDGLPARFTARRFAARIVERLNFTGGPAIKGQVRQHTNPGGVISDTAVQKLIMNSTSDGALRDLLQFEDREDRAFHFIDGYFDAVAHVFGGEWTGMAPRHSRLRHGAGIVAMGFVMDLLYSSQGAGTSTEFSRHLQLLKPYTAWTTGKWKLENSEFAWNEIQNTPSDIDLLTRHLVGVMKKQLRQNQRAVNR